jgi:hypothetical protein
MTFCIHALLIGEVITLLKVASCVFGSASSHHGANEQSSASAHASAIVAAHQCARSGTNNRSNHCAFHTTIGRRFIRRAATDLSVGILPAISLVKSELVKVFSRTRQHEHTRTSRYRCACAQRQNSRQH